MATEKLTSAQQARENLKAKNPKYKAYREQKELTRAERDAKLKKIENLVIAGQDREAYRVFETLPLINQMTILVTPVVGDAIAAYEVGEFGTRAEERFAQNDILGGLGNRALQTMAGLSLVPAVGIVGDVAGKVGKSLGRVAKTDPNMPTGGPSTDLVEIKPNEYSGTKLDGVSIGLSSPNLKTLREMKSDKTQSLRKLVTRLVKANPDKVGELRMLDVIEDVKPGKFSGDRIVLTPEVRSFFSAFTDGKDIATPGGLDLYMTNKMPEAINVRTLAPNERQIGRDAGLDTVGGAKRRLYGVKGVDGSKNRFEHTNDFFASTPDYQVKDNTIAFDSVVADPDNPNVIRVNRIQSDYVEELGRAQKQRRALSEQYKKNPFSNNPFEKPEIKINEEIQALLQELKEVGEEANKNIGQMNKDETFNLLFEDYQLDPSGNIFKSGDSTLPKSRLTEEEKNIIGNRPPYLNPVVEKVMKDLGKRDNITEKLKASLKKENEVLFNEGFFQGAVNPRFIADYNDLAPGQIRISQRNLAYDSDVYRQTEDETFVLDSDYYGNTKLPVDRFGILKKMDLDSIEDAIKNVSFDDSKLVYKKDPYAKKNTSQTHKLPIRSIINETAQNTDKKVLEIPLDRIYSSGEIGGDDAGKIGVFDYYDDIYKEMMKISKELELPVGSVYKTEGNKETLSIFNPKIDDFENLEVNLDNMQINLDAVREALAQGKTIDAFKDGGLASIEDIEVLPVRFTRLLQAAESPAEAEALGRSLGMQDREILEELDMIEFDSLYRPDMLYGDFRDLTLEELQRLREREMEEGVIRGGDHIDSLLNKI